MPLVASPEQRGSFTCSTSSHGPETSTPDGADAANGSNWVVDVVSSIEPLPLNTVAPAEALTPTVASAAAAKVNRICRWTLKVMPIAVEG